MRQEIAKQADARLDPALIERERNRFGARALGFLILLNGAAALVLLSILGRAPEGSHRHQNGGGDVVFQRGGRCRASELVPRLFEPNDCLGGARAHGTSGAASKLLALSPLLAAPPRFSPE